MDLVTFKFYKIKNKNWPSKIEHSYVSYLSFQVFSRQLFSLSVDSSILKSWPN